MIQLTENNNLDLDGNTFSKENVLDLLRLQKELLTHENIIFNIEECANIWMNYSGDLAAGWLFFPKKDEDILNTIRSSDFFTNFIEYSK